MSENADCAISGGFLRVPGLRRWQAKLAELAPRMLCHFRHLVNALNAGQGHRDGARRSHTLCDTKLCPVAALLSQVNLPRDSTLAPSPSRIAAWPVHVQKLAAPYSVHEPGHAPVARECVLAISKLARPQWHVGFALRARTPRPVLTISEIAAG